jgi:K+ transporter
MLEKGYITEEQLQKIIMIQRARAQERARHIREKRDDNLFGKLVIRFGYATEEQVNECMHIQEKMENDLFMRLGEIMVRKGYLSNEQVQAVLEYQKMKILTCKVCNTQYNVVMFQPGAKMRCYKCNAELRVPETLSSVAAEDIDFPERMQQMRQEAQKAAARKSKKPSPPTKKSE